MYEYILYRFTNNEWSEYGTYDMSDERDVKAFANASHEFGMLGLPVKAIKKHDEK